MKQIYTLIVAMLLSYTGVFAQAFITKWNTANTAPGSTDDKTITIPADGNNYNIVWQEMGGSNYSGSTTGSGTVTLTFPETGTYQVSITPGAGTFNSISFGGALLGIGDSLKLTGITQWGNINWNSMLRAFYGCSNLIVTATDIPNLSSVTDMSQMFQNCSSITTIPNLNSWIVSSVTSMDYMFYGASNFNQDISGWDVSNVTVMNNMFYGASKFNYSLNSWNTANVNDMSFMFAYATAFNQPLSNWNTSNVTAMNSMFQNASSFNRDIGGWDVSNVTTMGGMFQSASSFNQDIGSWNVSSVEDMSNMFALASVFNLNIGGWNISSLTNMSGMFYAASAFNQDLSNWNTSNVTNMGYAFASATNFNYSLPWDVSKVTTMADMFAHASSFNQTLGKWNLTNVTDVSNMLDNSGLDCPHYSSTLQGWARNANTPNNLKLGAASLKYGTSAVKARNMLTSTKGWTITSDALGSCSGADAIMGTVWDDANGDGSMQTGENATNAAAGWIYLVNTAGTIVDSSAVLGTGSYTFYNYTSGTTYNIILNKTAYATGTALSSSVLNTGWVNVSYNNGTPTPNTTGINSVTGPADLAVSTANVGAEQTPTATGVSKSVPSPQMFNLTDVNGYRGIKSSDGNAAPLAGTDPEDGNLATGASFTVQSIVSSTLLYYNGTLLSAGSKITNYDPSLLRMYGSNSSYGVSFTYTVIDAAGQLSPAAATYSLTSPYVLPVQYASPLAASLVTSGVQLDWATGSETNNKGFNVQRSSDGSTFTTLGFVNSKVVNGTGSGTHYSFTDKTVTSGTYYYRLAQMDQDGTTTPSDIVSIYVSGKGTLALSIYPNPASGTTTVSGLQTGSVVSIISMDGRVVKAFTATSTTQQVDLSGIAAGMYIVKTTVNGATVNAKFMVK